MPPAFGLGIDFGTSNTVALMRWPDGRVRPLLYGPSPLLPSAVFAPQTGDLVVGSDALHNARSDPAGLEPNPKQHIDDRSLLLGAREVTVVELIAAVLRHVTTEARRVAGDGELTVALSHPAGWGPARRQVLVDAAQAAGIAAPQLVPEPVAAINYFTTVLEHQVPAGKALVVYDLGAGTFDASIVVRRDTGFEIAAVDGLTDVGGLDIDATIVQWLNDRYSPAAPELWARLADAQDAESLRHRRMLWDDSRIAKEMLSRAPAVVLQMPSPLDVDAQLTREEFEAAAKPLIERTVRTTTALIDRAGVARDDVQGILLVGGGSRIPLVATMLHRALGIAPTVTEQPEIVVAEGCLFSLAPAGSPAPPVAVAASAMGAPAAVAGAEAEAAVAASPLWPSVPPPSAGGPELVAASGQASAAVPGFQPAAPATPAAVPESPAAGPRAKGTLYQTGQFPVVSRQQPGSVPPAPPAAPSAGPYAAMPGPPSAGPYAAMPGPAPAGPYAAVPGPPPAAPPDMRGVPARPVSVPPAVPVSAQPASPAPQRPRFVPPPIAAPMSPSAGGSSRVIPLYAPDSGGPQVPRAAAPPPGPAPVPTGRRRSLNAVLVGVVALALIAAVATVYVVYQGGSVAVPPLVDLSPVEANQALKKKGLSGNPVVNGKCADAKVTAQDDAAGAKVNKGSVVGYTVCGVKVPDVIGQAQADAAATLSDAGLQVSVEIVESSQPAGTVLTIVPDPGTIIGDSDDVTITVAKGTATPATDAATTAAPVTTAPTGGATTHTETIKVPDLIGQNVEYAKDQLHDQGFTGQIKTVDQYTDDPDKVGKVLSQDPKAGKQAAKNATFTLKVGKLSPSSGNPSPPAPTVTCTPPKVLVAGQCVAA